MKIFILLSLAIYPIATLAGVKAAKKITQSRHMKSKTAKQSHKSQWAYNLYRKNHTPPVAVPKPR